jgi:2-haloacid dehalogenase
MRRRDFLACTAAGIASGLAPAVFLREGRGERRIEAIAFDAFAIFDPRDVLRRAEDLVPGKGVALGETWRTRQFEYQWIRALTGRYADFWQTTADALDFAAQASNVELTKDERESLMGGFLELRAWHDAPEALTALRTSGLRLAILSNATPRILDAGIRNARLEETFEHLISTDASRTFKPDPRAYRMASEAFGLGDDRILFVASAGWDAAGAVSFGMPTYWINRENLPGERLDAKADGVGGDFAGLVDFVSVARRAESAARAQGSAR